MAPSRNSLRTFPVRLTAVNRSDRANASPGVSVSDVQSEASLSHLCLSDLWLAAAMWRGGSCSGVHPLVVVTDATVLMPDPRGGQGPSDAGS